MSSQTFVTPRISPGVRSVVDLGMLSLPVGQVGLACLCALAAGLLSSCATTLPLEDSESATVDRIADPGGGVEEVPLWEDPGIDVYVADDLPPELGEIIQETLEVASEEWGLYWPVEYWIFGVNETAGMQLVTKFCERREELAQWNFDDCMEREAGSEQHSMIEYQQLGAEALDAGEPFGTAGWNGAPDWGIHRFASTQPWGLTGNMGIPGDEDLKTLLHEYWHAVQNSFIPTLDHGVRDDLMGPVWFVEGSAEYMAQYGHRKLASEGRLPSVPEGDWPFTFESQMENKLVTVDEAFSGECEGRDLVSIESYEDPCSYLGYELGAWAIAYLAYLSGPDILLEEFHPIVADLGWREAFEEVAGTSLEDFSAEFMLFMDQSTEERLEILNVE